MTVLYKPVLIESVEQAETLLPSDTEFIVMRSYDDPAEGTWTYAYGHDFPRAWFPFIALVPVEAEEESREHPYRVEERVGYAYHQPVQQVRYKTRWETA